MYFSSNGDKRYMEKDIPLILRSCVKSRDKKSGRRLTQDLTHASGKSKYRINTGTW